MASRAVGGGVASADVITALRGSAPTRRRATCVCRRRATSCWCERIARAAADGVRADVSAQVLPMQPAVRAVAVSVARLFEALAAHVTVHAADGDADENVDIERRASDVDDDVARALLDTRQRLLEAAAAYRGVVLGLLAAHRIRVPTKDALACASAAVDRARVLTSSRRRGVSVLLARRAGRPRAAGARRRRVSRRQRGARAHAVRCLLCVCIDVLMSSLLQFDVATHQTSAAVDEGDVVVDRDHDGASADDGAERRRPGRRDARSSARRTRAAV